MTETAQNPGASFGLMPKPPNDVDAERSILAAMLLGNDAIGRALEMIMPSVFYRPAHKKIFEAIVALYERNEACDVITVSEELRKRGDLEAVGGTQALAVVLEYAGTTANLDEHMRIVQAKSVLRQLIDASRLIQEECYAAGDETSTILDSAEQRVFAIADSRIRKGFTPLKDLLKPAFEHIQTLSERKVRVTGVASGYKDLDELTAGFQRGDLVIIAGRPSMGKTAFALNIAENAAIKYKEAVAFFSLEMSNEQLVLRMLCSQSRVGLHKVRTGFLGREDWPDLVSGAGLLREAPIQIDDSGSPTILEIRAKCRRLKAEGKLGLVVIDYLQLIRASGRAENRVQEISQITRALKALAKELDVPIIALSQLSRAVETRGGGGRPQLSDLRESGSIEQDADVVMFVWREEKYKPDDQSVKGQADILVAKQRNGPTGDVKMTFIADCTRFEDATRRLMPGEMDSSF